MDSATTPTPNPIVRAVEKYPSFSEYLTALGTAMVDHYNSLLDGEENEGVRIRLLNDRVRAESVARLGR